MALTSDAMLALRSAVALVNSAEPPDTFTSSSDVEAWYTSVGYTGRHDGDDGELVALRELRPVLRALMTADHDDVAAIVNPVLRDAGAVPQLTRHGGLGWHVHAVADDEPLATRVLVETAMALIDLVTADEMSRLSVCADSRCRRLVVDFTRNRSRRFCSSQCTNRNAVAAYRDRQRAELALDGDAGPDVES